MDDLRTPRYFRHLRQQMSTHLDLSELKVLGYDLGVPVADLPGSSKLERIHHFLLLLAQYGRFQPLLTLLHEHNPFVPWIEDAAPIPPATTQQADAAQIIPDYAEALFQGYLRRMTRLLQNDLAEGKRDPVTAQRAADWTLRLLPQLDVARRGHLLIFLHDAGLIRQPQPILHLQQADFSGVDLRGAALALVDLSHTDLRGARLAGSDLRFANLAGACLQESYLSGVDARSVDWRWANLEKADLRHANLPGGQLSAANLAYAQLQSTNLQTANLSYACLKKANLRDANMEDVDLQGADLTDAIMPNGQLFVP